MSMGRRETEVAVVGGGPGGYAAAFMAADLGMTVTLIDPEANPGGVCLYHGCIPSKALLHVAKVIHDARRATAWGITFAPAAIDLEKIRAWKAQVIAQLTGGLGTLCQRRRITYIRGRAELLDATTLRIATPSGNDETLRFAHAILATGSRPASVPGLLPDSPRILTSTSALALEDVPKRLLVIGGGYIGLELGTVYATLGSQVTVVEMTAGLLPGVDRDLVSVVTKAVEGLFQAIHLNTKAVSMQESPDGIAVSLESAEAASTREVFDKVLVAVGRVPNSGGIGLESVRAQVDARGFIQVNLQRRTAEPTIYAIGDLTGEPMLAHKASHEGRIAAESIAGQAAAFEPHAIPAVVFTEPEIAWCGLTESQAKQQDRQVKVMRFPWAASGRALTIDSPEGVTKLVIDADTERILGVGIAGSGAGELIAEGVLAVEMAALATDLVGCIHPHPTLSETLMEAAQSFYGQSTHLYRPLRRAEARS